MFTLAPESSKNLHVTPLTLCDTNVGLTLVPELTVNAYSSSELDSGERGLDS